MQFKKFASNALKVKSQNYGGYIGTHTIDINKTLLLKFDQHGHCDIM